MKKKSIDNKEVNKFIEKRINEGKPRNEILEELSETYFDKKISRPDCYNTRTRKEEEI